MSTGFARPLRLGMVGGGTDAFIGAVHRMAARMDGRFILVAGALSSTPERARASATQLGLVAERGYHDYAEMARAEAARSDGIEVVSIVTPNDLHAPVAKAFLQAGIHVICDKPLAIDLGDARALADLRRRSGLVLGVTFNYSFYPLVRQAREIVAQGGIGAVQVVQVEYAQDWLTEPIEQAGQKQAHWRTDPARSGSGCIGDIGTHAFQLAEFVSGLRVERLIADLASAVPGRRVDDNASLLLRFSEGARGMLWASQVAPGNENNLRLRIYGTAGGLEWRQEEPNHLCLTRHGEPKRVIARGGPGAVSMGDAPDRLPSGHPEGYLEAFANAYAAIAEAISAVDPSPARAATDALLAGAVRAVAFVEAAQKSARAGAWANLDS